MRFEFGLTANQMHRFEGIFIYFGFLLLLFLLSERFVWLGGGERRLWKSSQSNSGSHRFRLFRRFLVPLMVYYAVTLGIPFANGAYRQGNSFLEHSLFVIMTSLLMILPIAIFQLYRKRGHGKLAMSVKRTKPAGA